MFGKAARWVVAMVLVTAAPLAAQSSEGFNTNFENSSGWTFQNINDQVKWNIDGSPVVFVSPTQTLNNIDSVGAGIQAEGVADAYAPTGFFNGPGDRFISHWCRFQFVETDYNGTRRWLKIGPQLLTAEVIVTFFYDDPDLPNGTFAGCFTFNDAPASSDPTNGEFVIECPSSDWHRHEFFVDQGSSEILHNGVPIPNTASFANLLEETVVLQIGFFFEWTGKPDCPIGGGNTAPAYGVVAWLIEDLTLAATDIDPFDPNPEEGGSGGTGGGGFDCVSGIIPIGGGTGFGGPFLGLLCLTVLIAGARQMKRRLVLAG